MKTLSYVHIPKCGGKGFQNLVSILENNELNVFFRDTQNFDGYDKYAFVQTHYGSHPMDHYPDIESACIFRDPLDRMVSQFAWAMMMDSYSKVFEEYTKDNIENLFRYFLFEDEKFVNNNNLQTKFVCNPIEEAIFYVLHVNRVLPEDGSIQFETPHSHGIFWKEWNLKNSKTSIEYAKSQVDKMTIIDTLENHDRFTTNVCNWFKENYDLDIEDEFRESLGDENPTFNYSVFTDNQGNEWTTAKLKALLTEEEIAKVYENNALDLELYNYVKDKVQ